MNRTKSFVFLFLVILLTIAAFPNRVVAQVSYPPVTPEEVQKTAIPTWQQNTIAPADPTTGSIPADSFPPIHGFTDCKKQPVLPLDPRYRTPAMDAGLINEADCRYYNDTVLRTTRIEVLVWCENILREDTAAVQRFREEIRWRITGYQIFAGVCNSLAAGHPYNLSEQFDITTLLICETAPDSSKKTSDLFHWAALDNASTDIQAGLKPCRGEKVETPRFDILYPFPPADR